MACIGVMYAIVACIICVAPLSSASSLLRFSMGTNGVGGTASANSEVDHSLLPSGAKGTNVWRQGKDNSGECEESGEDHGKGEYSCSWIL